MGPLTGPSEIWQYFQRVISNIIPHIDILSTFHETAHKWMLQDPMNDRSTSVQVMAWKSKVKVMGKQGNHHPLDSFFLFHIKRSIRSCNTIILKFNLENP